ncbi:MAG: hypothetical protein BZY77_04390 [SAR202 cluster bacterium Io17-Chloro-G5]|nr:MAG: hypothetical protein BZY77_04390 [SAR202 cluster bacterium Io17-Chloro-G5]
MFTPCIHRVRCGMVSPPKHLDLFLDSILGPYQACAPRLGRAKLAAIISAFILRVQRRFPLFQQRQNISIVYRESLL